MTESISTNRLAADVPQRFESYFRLQISDILVEASTGTWIEVKTHDSENIHHDFWFLIFISWSGSFSKLKEVRHSWRAFSFLWCIMSWWCILLLWVRGKSTSDWSNNFHSSHYRHFSLCWLSVQRKEKSCRNLNKTLFELYYNNVKS